MFVSLKITAAVALSAAILVAAPRDAPRSDATALVTIAAGDVVYRAAGEFLRAGNPQNGPKTVVSIARDFAIMKRQVSRAEYRACVAAGACKPIDKSAASGGEDIPVVGVSWQDATAYAGWLSAKTGYRYRLPTDEEWARAAGPAYRDDAFTEVSDPKDPAKRWLALYAAEARQTVPVDPTPQPFGSFGANPNGLLDVGGNVWEWTNSCFVRHAVDPVTGAISVANRNCGVRVVEGSHRSYATDFIRDPRVGGCSVGTPPANLGFRLIREDEGVLAELGAQLMATLKLPG